MIKRLVKFTYRYC